MSVFIFPATVFLHGTCMYSKKKIIFQILHNNAGVLAIMLKPCIELKLMQQTNPAPKKIFFFKGFLFDGRKGLNQKVS